MTVDFLYRPFARHDSDTRGWVTFLLEGHRAGEQLGYLAASWMPEGVFQERYPDLPAFIERIGGYRGRAIASEQERRDQRAYWRRRRRRFLEYHVQAAHVVYVRVHPPHQRRGVATALYLEAAAWVGARSASTLTSESRREPISYRGGRYRYGPQDLHPVPSLPLPRPPRCVARAHVAPR